MSGTASLPEDQKIFSAQELKNKGFSQYKRTKLVREGKLIKLNKSYYENADYRGEIMVALHNHSKETRKVAPGDKIAQFVMMPFYSPVISVEENLSETDRGAGGFGSTGK